jgi:spore coat-associated protein S
MSDVGEPNKLKHEYLERILDYYPFDVNNITLLSNKSGRKTWEIQTSDGVKILKQAQMNPRRMLYIANAHLHLLENGLPIAPINLTKNGSSCLGLGDLSFVVYDKVTGNEMTYYSKEHLEKTLEFAAKFYQASKGYKPMKESKKRARLNKWQKLYRWKLQELEGHKKIAESLTNDPFSILFLEHADKMLQRGRSALQDLDESYYKQCTIETLNEGGFCQQDFTLARLIEVDGSAFMKELHSITQDLPSRDLRVLLNKVMKKMSVWDHDLALHMLSSYDAVHPLSKNHYRVLWTDLAFPHLFCSIIHKYYLGQKRSWSDEKYMWALQNIIAVENSKDEFLNNFSSFYQEIKHLSGGKKDV